MKLIARMINIPCLIFIMFSLVIILTVFSVVLVLMVKKSRETSMQYRTLQMQEKLEGERYKIATELSKDILIEYDPKTDAMIHSERYKELVGKPPIISNYVTECKLRKEFIYQDDWGIYLEFCQQLKEGRPKIEATFRIKDLLGDYIWCQAMGKSILDDEGNPIRIFGKIVNIDLYKKELETLEYKATRDPLTGIYNHEVTVKKIDKYIRGHKNKKHMLMIIDFDDFKKVNDTYGHLQGDKVLTLVVSKIKELFSDGEIIGRIGGDEFVVFAGDIADYQEVILRAQKLNDALDDYYISQDYKIKISASIGVAVYPMDGKRYEQLIDHADQALYQVKDAGKNNYKLYSEAI